MTPEQPRLDRADVERDAIVKVLLEEGAGPGNSIHSWRCEYPDQYGPCDCVEQTADAVLALLPLLHPADERAARAEAWDRCHNTICTHKDWSGNCYHQGHVNPYRIESEEACDE